MAKCPATYSRSESNCKIFCGAFFDFLWFIGILRVLGSREKT